MINGVTSRAFSAFTLVRPQRGISYKQNIIETSRKRYARPRKEVEREILFRSHFGAKYKIEQKDLFS